MERIYLYFCTEETHELRHYWCSVYTQTRCRRLFLELGADSVPPGRPLGSGGRSFFPSSSSFGFVRQKCVLFPFCKTHLTQSREHRNCRGRHFSAVHPLNPLLENSFRSHFSFLHLLPSASSSFFTLWVLDDCQL